MNEIEWLRKLDAAASAADTGGVDVTNGVMREIYRRRAEEQGLRPVWYAALISSAAAAAALGAAAWALMLLQDPFVDLLSPVWTAFR